MCSRKSWTLNCSFYQVCFESCRCSCLVEPCMDANQMGFEQVSGGLWMPKLDSSSLTIVPQDLARSWTQTAELSKLSFAFVDFRWNQNWHLPAALQLWSTDHWQRGCCQQLCQGSLHHRKRADWENSGHGEEGLREVSRLARFPGLSLLWRWNRIRIFIAADGEVVQWVWKEVQADIFHLSSSRSEFLLAHVKVHLHIYDHKLAKLPKHGL